jgi:hypothetical protein
MMAAKKKLQVFVSSTYLDLKEERQAAVEAILKAGHIPAGMELFSAGNESQLDTIRRWIDESDVYMLILGGRYGSVDSSTALSYTELEYDYAVSRDIPIFAAVISESALDAKVKAGGATLIETDHPKEFKAFRAKVLSRISTFFNDAKDIKLAVHETLSDFMARYEFTGWVSGREIVESAALLEELSQLRKQKSAIEKELAQLKRDGAKPANETSKWAQLEFEEIRSVLSELMISTNLIGKSGELKEYAVLSFLYSFKDAMVTGVTNQAGMSPINKLLYFNVFPKLEVYGLAALDTIPKVRWRRYHLTPKGLALLAYLDKLVLSAGKKKQPVNDKAE